MGDERDEGTPDDGAVKGGCGDEDDDDEHNALVDDAKDADGCRPDAGEQDGGAGSGDEDDFETLRW